MPSFPQAGPGVLASGMGPLGGLEGLFGAHAGGDGGQGDALAQLLGQYDLLVPPQVGW